VLELPVPPSPDPPKPPEPPDPEPPEFEPLPEPPAELAVFPVLHAVSRREYARMQAKVSNFQGEHDGGNMTFYFFAGARRREEDVSSYFVARGHVPA